MRTILAIAKRDFKSYFTSPIAYVVIGSFLGIMGFFFFIGLEAFFKESMRAQQYGQSAKSLTDGVILPLYATMNVILLFFVPLITMRLISEERKNHTLALLSTSPVKNTEIILGKFLAASWLLEIMLVLTLVYPVTLYFTGNPEIGPILASLFGTMLIGTSYIAIGIFYSSMTENQIVAVVLTMGTLLLSWFISWVKFIVSGVWGEFFGYISLLTHFEDFGRGIINSADLVYYLSVIGVGLFLSVKILDSYRWRS